MALLLVVVDVGGFHAEQSASPLEDGRPHVPGPHEAGLPSSCDFVSCACRCVPGQCVRGGGAVTAVRSFSEGCG